MYTVLTWVVLALFPVGASYRDSLASPIDKQDNKHWHWLGFTFRMVFTIIVCPLDYAWAYAWYFWIVFDGFYNVFTNKSWWFIGSTAFSDKLIKTMGGHWYKFAGLAFAIGYLIFKELI